jgi:hypothetical protein
MVHQSLPVGDVQCGLIGAIKRTKIVKFFTKGVAPVSARG